MTTATPTQPQTAVDADGQGPTDPARDAAAWPLELREIPITQIGMGANVRSTPTDDDLHPLILSIKSRGVLSPIKLVEVGAAKYELVYGQRRLMAATRAGLKTIPALVAAGSSDETHTIEQLLENLQREDLNPLDEAKAYRALLDAGLSQRQLAEQLGRAQPTIAMALRLLKVPEAIQAQVASGALSASHVKAIASLPDAEQEEVARRAVEHKLSAHDVEREVSLAQQRAVDADKERDLAGVVVPKVEKMLAERKATKDGTSLVVSSEALSQALVKAGWTVVEPKSMSSLYAGAKDACAVLEVRWFAAWGTNYGPDVQAVCVDLEHQAARKAADEKARAAEKVKWEKQRTASAAKQEQLDVIRAKEREILAGVVAARPWGLDMERILLAVLIDANEIYTRDAVDDLVERHVAEDQRGPLADNDDPAWAIISALPAPAVKAEIGLAIADSLTASRGYQANGEEAGPSGALGRLRELARVELEAKPKVGKAGSKGGE